MPAPSLSIILPAFNEERRLPGSLVALNGYLDEHFPDAEVIVADDGSADSTADTVGASASRFPRVRLLSLPHRGKGNAIRAGMLEATGEVRIFMDVDLAVPVEAIAEAATLACSHDIVIGSREISGSVRLGEPRSRHLMGRVFNFAVRRIAGIDQSDTQCGFKAFTANAADSLFQRQRSNGFGFDVELLVLAKKRGLSVAQLPVEWRYGPESRVRWHHPFRMLFEVVAIRARSLRGTYD
jgi:glycosyltransferase involved in cell wall biosynthesis